MYTSSTYFNEKINDLIKTKKSVYMVHEWSYGRTWWHPVLFPENLATAYGRTYYQYKSYAKFEFQLSCKMWTGVTTADN